MLAPSSLKSVKGCEGNGVLSSSGAGGGGGGPGGRQRGGARGRARKRTEGLGVRRRRGLGRRRCAQRGQVAGRTPPPSKSSDQKEGG